MTKTKMNILLFITVLSVFTIICGVSYGLTEGEDPLVTQSYVEMRIEQVKTYIDEKVAAINTGTGSSGAAVFQPVTVPVGSKLIGGTGTELIVRVGYSKAIASVDGGLVDATGGVDIQNSKDVPKQHLIIIPRADGRGILIGGTTQAVVMVKGTYSIQK